MIRVPSHLPKLMAVKTLLVMINLYEQSSGVDFHTNYIIISLWVIWNVDVLDSYGGIWINN